MSGGTDWKMSHTSGCVKVLGPDLTGVPGVCVVTPLNGFKNDIRKYVSCSGGFCL